jgi:hypothetical protein
MLSWLSGWPVLERRYAIRDPHLALQPLRWAVLGRGMFLNVRYRNMLHVGADARGLVLQYRPLLSFLGARPKTVLVPWRDVRPGENSRAIPNFALFPIKTLLLGPEGIALTMPRGIVRTPAG